MWKEPFIRRGLIVVALLAALVVKPATQERPASGASPVTPAGQRQGEPPAPAADVGQASAEAERWNRVFGQAVPVYRTDANAFLAFALERMQRERLLPGKAALELAMGDGRNALLLAEKGLDVTGLDISTVALEQARARAAEKHLSLTALEQDVFTYDYGKEKWDLITVIYFNPAIQILDQLEAAVKPGGLIVIEGQGSEHTGAGPPPATRFRPNQLLQAFGDWRILQYEDGRFDCDWAPGQPTHVVRLLAQKPVGAGK